METWGTTRPNWGCYDFWIIGLKLYFKSVRVSRSADSYKSCETLGTPILYTVGL